MTHPAHTASICCIIIFCAIVMGFPPALSGLGESPPASEQYDTAPPESRTSVSISKGKALILLTMGVIGVLSVRRKKKASKRPAQTANPKTPDGDRDKVFVELNKQYLNLQYRITQHKFSGDTPPDGLLKEISDIERKIRLISRALE